MRYELRPAPEDVRQTLGVVGAMPGREVFAVHPWGYLEGLEVEFPQPLPMLDASERIEVVIEVRRNGVQVGGFTVRSRHRNVEWRR